MLLKRLSHLPTLLIRLANSPAGRTFLISLGTWLVAFIFCRYRFWRDPHSAFFDGSDRQYEFKYSTFRAKQGLEYLQDLASNNGTKHAASNPEICAAFVTVKRESDQYIDAAIGSMLEGLTNWERSQLTLQILFADTDPESHPTWKQPWLRDAVDWAGTYKVSVEEKQYLADLMEKRLFAEKGVYDYLYALNLCYETGAPYILLLEDDIVMADSWLAKTRQAFLTIENNSDLHNQPFWNYLYLRLFYTETSMRWRVNEDYWFRRMDLVFAIGSSTTLVLLLILRRYVKYTHRHLDVWAMMVICLVTVPAFIALAFMVGKYSLFPPRGVFRMPRYGCCSQALLYPRHRIPAMSQWFRDWNAPEGGGLNGKGRGKAYDLTDRMIDWYAQENDMKLLALAPQLVQHVGVKSSRDNLDINGRSTRAFWFEDYDPATLRREHDALTGP